MTPVKSTFLVAAATATALACASLFVATPAAALPAAGLVPVRGPSFVEVTSYRINESVRARVEPGMTRDAVASLIGAPARTMRFPLTRTTAWDYDFVDAWGYASEFSVILDDGGVVVGKVASRNDY